jgi:hypothetical protein
MPTVEEVAALLEAVTPTDVQALPPAQRRRFAAACRRAVEMATRADAPKVGGVLYDLRGGRQG